MNYRTTTLMARTDYTGDAHPIVDIDVVDPISQIVVIVEPDNAVGWVGSKGHPVRLIPKLEIIDGSDVLYSLVGAEAHAVDFYDNGKLALGDIQYLTGQPCRVPIQMNFGRYLWDPELAFDPKKFINPQLKISLDFDAGGLVHNHVFITVLAKIFDEKSISPIGFLMNKEIKDFVMGPNAHEYTDLPVDFPYRRLFVRAQEYGSWPDWNIAHIKLSEDQDKKIPLDLTGEQIADSIVTQFPPVTGNIKSQVTNVLATWHNVATRATSIMATTWRNLATDQNPCVYNINGGTFNLIGSVGGNAHFFERGYCPHGVLCIPFGLQNEIADWYDVTKVNSLKLDITGAAGLAGTETCQVHLQQLRRY